MRRGEEIVSHLPAIESGARQQVSQIIRIPLVTVVTNQVLQRALAARCIASTVSRRVAASLPRRRQQLAPLIVQLVYDVDWCAIVGLFPRRERDRVRYQELPGLRILYSTLKSW